MWYIKAGRMKRLCSPTDLVSYVILSFSRHFPLRTSGIIHGTPNTTETTWSMGSVLQLLKSRFRKYGCDRKWVPSELPKLHKEPDFLQLDFGLHKMVDFGPPCPQQSSVKPLIFDVPSEISELSYRSVINQLTESVINQLTESPVAWFQSPPPAFSEALKSPEAGKVSHALSAGSIVSAGELLARHGRSVHDFMGISWARKTSALYDHF